MMRYFVRVDDNPTTETYGMVRGVMRFETETAMPERWDKETQAWVYHPEVVDAFGLGGANDHFEVAEDFANLAIEAWQSGTTPPNVFGPGAGLTSRMSRPTSGPMRIVKWD